MFFPGSGHWSDRWELVLVKTFLRRRSEVSSPVLSGIITATISSSGSGSGVAFILLGLS